jgi:Aerobic-type carbon monoxide dehydrogenase, middle subunit CoxM/CutM homologs
MARLPIPPRCRRRSRLGRAGGADRRPSGPQPRDHRGIDLQQRSGRRLSGRPGGLDATVQTNKRKIKADDFFKGMFETALEDGEIVTAVSFPKPEKAGYAKFPTRPRATPWWG